MEISNEDNVNMQENGIADTWLYSVPQDDNGKTVEESNVNRPVSPLFVTIALPALFSAFGLSQAIAEDVSPQATIVQSNAENLLEDVDTILGLTNAIEKKQARIIKEYLEQIFLVGVDRTKPIRMDVHFEGGKIEYRPHFPISNFKDFMGSVNAFGIASRRVGFLTYQLKNAYTGYVLYKNRYASFAENRAVLPEKTFPNPVTVIEPLLALDHDIATEFKNSATGADALKARRKEFVDNFRKELLAAVKKKKDESDDDFALRKLAAEQQLDDIERFYVETANFTGGWTTDNSTGNGQLEGTLAAIPDTALAKMMGMLGKKHSQFAALAKPEKSILHLRVNHPLDEMRKEHFKQFFAALRSRSDNRTDQREKLNATQKQNRKKINDLLHQFFDVNTEAGLGDVYVDVQQIGENKRTLIAGFAVADDQGPTIEQVIDLLPKVNPEHEITKSVAKQGDVVIHQIEVTTREQPHFDRFFGTEKGALLVGIGPNTIWLAAGVNAQEDLVAVVRQTQEGEHSDQVSPVFFSLEIALKPWIDLRARRADAESGDPVLRKQAVESFNEDDDQLTVEMKVENGEIKGKLITQPGILRLAGKLAAEFSKEQLE